ncbi:adhesion G protein-coupled receptor A3 isoform X2 [Centruroides vittatus]|uniref:adhesion G protein-coupled receptor A3 isoform X2 n=1 Tax=Centruroides vittatus TaxID=120091 RepID=UPI0035105F0E
MGAFYALAYAVFVSTLSYEVVACPSVCKCGPIKSRTPDRIKLGQRITCAMTDVTSVGDFLLEEMPRDTIYLDLSRNLISKIQEGAFLNLSNVEKLDLSHNKLASLSARMFESLTSLQRLILEHNAISRLPKGVFNYMISLKTIDLSSNPLICDCQLKWFIEWTRSKGVRITQETACQFPLKLRGMSISQLSKKDLHCNWPVQLPLFELSPKVNQLVFEGDTLLFQCRVSNVEDNIKLNWMLDDLAITTDPLGVVAVQTHVSQDGSVLRSLLSISRLRTHHSGIWRCHVETPRGNESRSIQIIVIAENNRVCSRMMTSDNKGQYLWPETLASITVELQCEGIPAGALGYVPAFAYHTCNNEGKWENLDTSACPYVSEVTKVFEQFSKTNLSLSKTNVLDSARGLRNYTGDGSMLKDKMDVVFIARTIENYMEFAGHHKEIGEILIDVINIIMGVDKKLLHAAQTEDNSCSRLVRSLESLSDILIESALNRNKNHLAVEEFFAKSEGFHGMTCTSYKQNYNVKNLPLKSWLENFHTDKILHCNNLNFTSLPTTISKEKKIEAFIQLPSSLFQEIPTKGPKHKLHFIIYHNSVLFPRPASIKEWREVTSSVISCKVALVPARNLTEPVVVMLQVPAYTSDVEPVWWDVNAADGQGDWSSNGCKILQVQNNLITFSCDKLATFGVLQDVEALLAELNLQRAQFRPSHPAIYFGSLVCIGGLGATILIYCCSHKEIKMPKKNKHSLVNTWISMTVLCLTFTFGVHQTDYTKICEAVGLILHYLTFCTLLWMIITVSNLYKKLTKTDPPELLPDEEIPEQLLPPKPMLRFYLVGWGISTIVCGISAAVLLENYGGPNYCFLSFNPSLAAFYGPAAVLVFFLVIFFLLIYCVLCENNKITMTGIPVCDNIPIADNVVMELTQTNHEEGSLHSCGDNNSENMEDVEYSCHMQLRAHVILLLLFIFAWASGAMATGRPFINHLPADNLIFSLLYCFFSTLIGSFVFSFFCYSRQDVRQYIKNWKYRKIQLKVKQEMTRETQPTEILSSNNPSSQEGHINASLSHQGSDKLTNCNILSSHPSSTEHSFNGAEMFYDPRQSVVARKFFEKNRRQQQLKLLQKNNLQKEAADICDENNLDDNEQKIKLEPTTANSIQNPHNINLSSHNQRNNCSSIQTKDDLENNSCGSSENNRCQTIPLRKNSHLKFNKQNTFTKLCENNAKSHIKDNNSTSNGSLNNHLHLSLPPWMIVSQNCKNHKDSCAECSDCSQIPSSIISNTCFSDLTGCNLNHVGNNKHRPRSRNRANHWKKNRRQHSWDGRSKCENKRTHHSNHSVHSNKAYQYSSNKKHYDQHNEDCYFPRSYSAYEQPCKAPTESVSGGDSELSHQQEISM